MQTTASSSDLEKTGKLSLPGELAASRFYTKNALFQLFMVSAFPVHLWYLLMAFRDFGWVALRTSAWDALGLVSYALLVALFESLGVFVAALLLGFLLPRAWDVKRRLAVLGILVLVVSSWSILAKVFSMYASPVPRALLDFLAGSGHPLRILWGISFVLVLLSVLLPVVWIGRFPRSGTSIVSFFDRLIVLSSFYLFLDVVALILIGIRNILLWPGL